MFSYVIIKEIGSHSDFRYEPIAVFTSEEAANEYVNIIVSRQQKLDEIATLKNKWFDDGIVYIVQKVATGNTQMMQIDDSQIDNDLNEAREWRKKQDENEAQQDKIIANQFLDWWETEMHKNPSFDSTEHIRSHTPIVKRYACRTNDVRAWAWVNREMHALEKLLPWCS